MRIPLQYFFILFLFDFPFFFLFFYFFFLLTFHYFSFSSLVSSISQFRPLTSGDRPENKKGRKWSRKLELNQDGLKRDSQNKEEMRTHLQPAVVQSWKTEGTDWVPSVFRSIGGPQSAPVVLSATWMGGLENN